MVVTLAELVLLGLLADWLFRSLRMPGLIGMLLLGVVFGPYVCDFISPSVHTISADLRLIALIVILLRAGFELSKQALARVGRMALLLSCIPAVFEGAVVTLVGPSLLGISYFESAILGAVLAAVSPAVVVPLMIRLIEERRGVEKGIPTLILAASSVDDVFVIVIYSVLIGIYTGGQVNLAWELLGIPVSILTGVCIGFGVGGILIMLFRRFNPRATKRVLIILGISVLLVRGERLLENVFPFAALLAVMAIGFIILEKQEHFAHEISAKLAKIWILAEIVLFTMVGAQVNVHVALEAGLAGALLILVGLLGRSIGTYACLLGSSLSGRERLFVVVSYLPKATVQAAIGGAPLAAMRAAGMSTGPGEIILAVAVLSIVLTAPLGAWAISYLGERLLCVEPQAGEEAVEAAQESNVD